MRGVPVLHRRARGAGARGPRPQRSKLGLRFGARRYRALRAAWCFRHRTLRGLPAIWEQPQLTWRL